MADHVRTYQLNNFLQMFIFILPLSEPNNNVNNIICIRLIIFQNYDKIIVQIYRNLQSISCQIYIMECYIGI